MDALVLALAMRLREDTPVDALLALLPPEDRAGVEAALDEIGIPNAGQRLRTLRLEQIARQRQAAAERSGMELGLIAPELAAWLARPF